MSGESILCLCLTFIPIIIAVIFTVYYKNVMYMVISSISIVFFISFVGSMFPDPTDKDIKENKAVYIEERHIVIKNNDTIYNYKTYKREWLPEWKYGRKQLNK